MWCTRWMPASLSCFARSVDMWPIDAQRFRFVCSATSRAPSSTFWKSRFDSPWPCVTMQKRCAPAASAARACSRICSGDIIACIGVGASAKRDWPQKPQSSAQPPDLAFTSEHRSVESPKRSVRASNARSTRASISPRSSISPSATASSWVMRGAKRYLQTGEEPGGARCGKVGGGRTADRCRGEGESRRERRVQGLRKGSTTSARRRCGPITRSRSMAGFVRRQLEPDNAAGHASAS